MSLWEAVQIALESLGQNRFRSFLTMLGIIIGVAAVILLVSLGEGIKGYVTSQVESLGTNVIIVLPGKIQTTGGPPLPLVSAKKLTVKDALVLEERCRRITHVAPVIGATGLIKYGNRARNSLVLGTTHEIQDVRNLRVDVGSFLPRTWYRSERRLCVLGRTVKEELFGRSNPLGKFVSIDGTKFRVIGVMKKKGRSLGFDLDDLAFIPVLAAQAIFDTEKLTEILATTRTSREIPAAIEEIRELMLRRHEGHEDFTVHDQGDMLSVLERILDILTYALAGIAGISLLVGGIGIMNIMLVSVKERTREIGIRLAIGAKRQDVLAQFLSEALCLSLTGGILGIFCGVGGGRLAQVLIPVLPLRFSSWNVLLAFSVAFVVGVFFGVFPARKASQLDPVEALRYE